MKKAFILLSLGVFMVIACNNGANDPVEQADSANDEARKDTMSMAPAPDAATSSFLVDAANGGMAEVSLSRLAIEKSSNAAVKKFAELMITDHTAANEQIRSLAAQKNVTLPSDVSDEKRKAADDLMKKAGKDFDKSYIDMMIKDHENTIDLFDKASSKVMNADVVAFINNTLPKLRSHLESIKSIRNSVK